MAAGAISARAGRNPAPERPKKGSYVVGFASGLAPETEFRLPFARGTGADRGPGLPPGRSDVPPAPSLFAFCPSAPAGGSGTHLGPVPGRAGLRPGRARLRTLAHMPAEHRGAHHHRRMERWSQRWPLQCNGGRGRQRRGRWNGRVGWRRNWWHRHHSGRRMQPQRSLCLQRARLPTATRLRQWLLRRLRHLSRAPALRHAARARGALPTGRRGVRGSPPR